MFFYQQFINANVMAIHDVFLQVWVLNDTKFVFCVLNRRFGNPCCKGELKYIIWWFCVTIYKQCLLYMNIMHICVDAAHFAVVCQANNAEKSCVNGSWPEHHSRTITFSIWSHEEYVTPNIHTQNYLWQYTEKWQLSIKYYCCRCKNK